MPCPAWDILPSHHFTLSPQQSSPHLTHPPFLPHPALAADQLSLTRNMTVQQLDVRGSSRLAGGAQVGTAAKGQAQGLVVVGCSTVCQRTGWWNAWFAQQERASR